jgi:DNA-binding LytR/AlgR family response regulator
MNCIIVDDDVFTRSLVESFVNRTDTLNLLASCSSAKEALKQIATQPVELIFLDIEMPAMNGIQFLDYFDRNGIQIIFITSSEKYAVKAIDLEVTDYLIKPIEEERFLKGVMRALKRKKMNGNQETGDLFVKVNSRMVRICMNNIQYIEALTNHVSIYVSSGERHVVLSTLKAMEARLPEDKFTRIHNSYIVNLDHIAALEDNGVIIGKKFLSVSRSHRKNLLSRLKTV